MAAQITNTDYHEAVFITHYINPHLFWLRYEEIAMKDQQMVDIQREIFEYILQEQNLTSLKHFTPELGEIVICYHDVRAQWIRGQVDYIMETITKEKSFILWAVDYGHPFKCKMKQIKHCPEHIKKVKTNVFLAGLDNIVPTEMRFNLRTGVKELTEITDWTAGATSEIDRLIQNANVITFRQQKHAKNGQIFGILSVLSHQNRKFIANEILLDLNLAKVTDHFLEDIQKITTTRFQRWLNNDRIPFQNILNDKESSHVPMMNIPNTKLTQGENLPNKTAYEMYAIKKVNDWADRNTISLINEPYKSFDIDNSFHNEQEVNNSSNMPESDICDESKISLKSKIIDIDDEDEIVSYDRQEHNRRLLMKNYEKSIPPPPTDDDIKKFENYGIISRKPSPTYSSPKPIKGNTNMKYNLLPAGIDLSKRKFIKNQMLLNSVINYSKPIIEPNFDEQSVFSVSSGSGRGRKLIKSSIFQKSMNEDGEKLKSNDSCTENNLIEFSSSSKDESSDDKFSSQIPSVETFKHNKFGDVLNTTPTSEFGLMEKERSNSHKEIFENNTSFKSENGENSISSRKKNMDLHDQQKIDISRNLSLGRGASAFQFETNLSATRSDSPGIGIAVNAAEFEKDEKYGKLQSDVKNAANKERHLANVIGIQRVLVHGPRITQPIDSITKAYFCDEVHENFRAMRINKVFRVQTYGWPHINRGGSCIIVNERQTGKTLTYLPAIYSLVKTQKEQNRNSGSPGPRAVIVCSSSKEVEKQNYILTRFMNPHKDLDKLQIVEAFGTRNEKFIINKLLNGCDILLTTPSCFYRLVNKSNNLFDSNKIQHLIIDNYNLIIDKFSKEINKLFQVCCTRIMKNDQEKFRTQIIVTSKTWRPKFMNLLKSMENPIICFGSYIEAAVYAQTDISLQFLTSDIKFEAVFRFLSGERYKNEKTLIVCNNFEEVQKLFKILHMKSFMCQAFDRNSNAKDIDMFKQEWNNESANRMTLLICDDSILPHLGISVAQNIIHFSLPETWTKFTFRLSSFFEYYTDLLKSTKNEFYKPKAKSVIFLDEKNSKQIPKLINFMQEHFPHLQIPPEVLLIAQQEKTRMEEICDADGNLTPICPEFLQFGKCRFQIDCKIRHSINAKDVPQDFLPTNGKISFKILKIHSPTHYTVQLLCHKTNVNLHNDDWVHIVRSNEYVTFQIKLNQFLTDVDNQKIHCPAMVKDICLLRADDSFWRCRVIKKSEPRFGFKGAVFIKVEALDNGKLFDCMSDELLVLPEEFKDFPPQAISVRLCGIIPQDFETEWDTKTNNIMKKWIEIYVKDECHIEGNIELTLKDTIFINTLYIVQSMNAVKRDGIVLSIKNNLIKKNFAVVNRSHIEIIKAMAINCGIVKKKEIHEPEHRKQEKNVENESIIDYIDDEITNLEIIENKVESMILKASASTTSSLSSSKSQNEGIIENESVRNASCSDNDQWSSTLNSDSYSNEDEKWYALNENTKYRVTVSAYYDPDEFYIQDNYHMAKFKVLTDEIQKYVSELQQPRPVITNIENGMLCLAPFEGIYNRGKIFNICEERLLGKENNEEIVTKVKVFFVDYGDTAVFDVKDILKIPDYLAYEYNFSAVRCKLIGIRPKTSKSWDPEIANKIYDEFIETPEVTYVQQFKRSNISNELFSKMKSYEVAMLNYVSDTQINVNDVIVNHGYAEYDPDSKHFLDTFKFNGELLSDDDLTDFNHAIENLKEYMNRKMSNNQIEKVERPVEEKPEEKVIEKENNSLLNESLPKLISKFKYPTIKWHQAESVIELKIAAPDIQHYSIDISATNMYIDITYQNERRCGILNFFGCVETKLSSIEIRGLNIYVLLVKSCKGKHLNWPRLLQNSDKVHWLTYDFKDFDFSDEDRKYKINLQFNPTDFHATSDDSYEFEDEFDNVGDTTESDSE